MTRLEEDISTNLATNDTDLVRSVRNGSPDALAVLFTRHSGMVFAVAMRFLCDRAGADDVVQDVFVALPNALAQYREQGSLPAWIRQLTVRTSLMRLRRERRWVSESDATGQGTAITTSFPPATVERIALDRALALLPDVLRVVFILKEIEGYSHSEIAGMHAISERASRVRLHRAWKQLRKELRS